MNYCEYLQSAEYILKHGGGVQPEVAVVLGSGLGGIAELLENPLRLSYRDIPCFPTPMNPAHRGELLLGTVGSKGVAFLNGRFHAYEGHSYSQTVIPIRMLKCAGVKTLILTNAAGAVNESFNVGDIMLITDHIKLAGEGPEEGPQPEELGERFFSMNHAYSPKLASLAKNCAAKLDIELKEGTYFYMRGPQYETPAEIRAIRLLGGDAVGMSTVGEVITAAKLKLNTLAFSCITNKAAGMCQTPPNDKEVVENGVVFQKNLRLLIEKVIGLS
ncbi:MAG: purine-nucleoside phosphorylase [Oscillospiraceae bacterium]|nr:purine-nucleoside phosphorylase [Oscillospiraceae bacterium]